MSPKKIRVLVVDDNKNFLKTFEQTLTAKGCAVAVASNPGKACQMVLNDIFHVVFIDCILLSDQGMELAKKIRQLLDSSLEIVIMSGIVSNESISNFSDLSSLDFLKKPLSNRKVDAILKQVQNKYVYSGSESLVKGIYSEKFSEDFFLQRLINLKRISPPEFLLILGGILKSKENLILQVSLEGKVSSRIFFQKGLITGFELNKEAFFNSLVSRGWFAVGDIYKLEKKLKGKGPIFHKLIEEGFLSPYQAHIFQLQQLVKYFKLIARQKEIAINTELFKASNNYLEMDGSLLADKIFPCLKDLQEKDLEKVFDKNVMLSGFKMRSSAVSKKYIPTAQPVVDKLKEGIRISAIQSEMSIGQKDLHTLFLYILLKGGAYYLDSNSNMQAVQHLLKRYQSIYKFFDKNSPKEIFRTMGNLNSTTPINESLVSNMYRMFLKNNHIDRFSANLPSEVIKSINNVTIKLKQIYNEFIKPKKPEDGAEKAKEMKKTIELSKNKKVCRSSMEKRDYEKAFSIISQVSKKDLSKDTDWMLLYIWLGVKAPNCDLNLDILREFKASIGLAKMSLMKNALYFYVLGLLFVTQGNTQKAIMFFSRSKELDMSFQPAFEEYKHTVIKEKNKKTGIFSKYFQKKTKAS